MTSKTPDITTAAILPYRKLPRHISSHNAGYNRGFKTAKAFADSYAQFQADIAYKQGHNDGYALGLKEPLWTEDDICQYYRRIDVAKI